MCMPGLCSAQIIFHTRRDRTARSFTFSSFMVRIAQLLFLRVIQPTYLLSHCLVLLDEGMDGLVSPSSTRDSGDTVVLGSRRGGDRMADQDGEGLVVPGRGVWN